jgi:hypothetical protein
MFRVTESSISTRCNPRTSSSRGRAGQEVVAEWKAKRQMAERVGGSFVVKAKVEAGGRGFGKRQSGVGASGAKGGSVAGWIEKTFNLRKN